MVKHNFQGQWDDWTSLQVLAAKPWNPNSVGSTWWEDKNSSCNLSSDRLTHMPCAWIHTWHVTYTYMCVCMCIYKQIKNDNNKIICKLKVVVQDCDPNTWEEGAKRPGAYGQPRLHKILPQENENNKKITSKSQDQISFSYPLWLLSSRINTGNRCTDPEQNVQTTIVARLGGRSAFIGNGDQPFILFSKN